MRKIETDGERAQSATASSPQRELWVRPVKHVSTPTRAGSHSRSSPPTAHAVGLRLSRAQRAPGHCTHLLHRGLDSYARDALADTIVRSPLTRNRFEEEIAWDCTCRRKAADRARCSFHDVQESESAHRHADQAGAGRAHSRNRQAGSQAEAHEATSVRTSNRRVKPAARQYVVVLGARIPSS
jgi:hypothetical protein